MGSMLINLRNGLLMYREYFKCKKSVREKPIIKAG